MKSSTVYYGFTALNTLLMVVLKNPLSGVIALCFLGAAEYFRRKGN